MKQPTIMLEAMAKTHFSGCRNRPTIFRCVTLPFIPLPPRNAFVEPLVLTRLSAVIAIGEIPGERLDPAGIGEVKDGTDRPIAIERAVIGVVSETV